MNLLIMLKANDWIKVYLIFILAFTVQLLISLFINNWNFAYPLDDPYIHLAIAKNFSEFGVWGPTQYEFASSSSSIMFTLLLSFFFVIGLKTVLISLIINLLGAGLLFWILNKIAILEDWRKSTYNIISILILIFAPTIALVFSGMEHILHISVSLLLVYYAADIISGKTGNKSTLLLTIFSFLAVSLRYETLFLIFVIVILFLIRRKFIPLLFISLGALIPITIFGLISLKNGSYFLPNTLLIKGISPEITLSGILNQSILWIERIFTYPHLLTCFLLLSFNIFSSPKEKRNLNNKWFVFSVIVIFSLILHLTFARIGWFYRYEAYLAVLSIFSLAPYFNRKFKLELNLSDLLLKNKITIVILIILFIPLSYRFISSLYKASLAPKNIYEQQIQTAEFIKTNNYKSVVLNDIGAVSYYNDIKIIDLLGLANKD
ncbi:hypothetical protein ACFLSQ_11550, partial [Bacteroidota bacterium]